MLKEVALLTCLCLSMLVPGQPAAIAQTVEKEPLPFKQKHPILYWAVAGPTYPFRHPIKTKDGVMYPIAHPCKFGKAYNESGASGAVGFGLALFGTTCGVRTWAKQNPQVKFFGGK